MNSNKGRSGRKAKDKRTRRTFTAWECGHDAAGNSFTHYGTDPEEPRRRRATILTARRVHGKEWQRKDNGHY